MRRTVLGLSLCCALLLAACGADLATFEGSLQGLEERGRRADSIDALMSHIKPVRDIYQKADMTERAVDALIAAYEVNESRLGLLRALADLREDYEYARPEVAAAYATKLTPFLTRVLESYAEGQNEQLVVEACALLGSLQAAEASEALGALAEKTTDPRIKLAAVTALGDMRDKRALSPLTNVFLSEAPKEELEIKRVIARKLGESGMVEAAPILVAGLYIEVDDVSLFPYVQPALLDLGAKASIPAIIAALEGKNKMVDFVNENLDAGIREFKAAWVLGDFYTRRTKAIDVLIDMLKDDKGNPSPRMGAAEPLGKLGGERAREALLKYADVGHWADRRAIVRGLYYLNDAETVPTLLSLASKAGITTTNGRKHHHLRWEAGRAVALVGGADALASFKAIAAEETDEETAARFDFYMKGFDRAATCDMDIGCWEDLLLDSDPAVVQKAAWMIAQFADNSSFPALMDAAVEPIPVRKKDGKADPRGRFSILYAMNRLRPKGMDVTPLAELINARDGAEVPRLQLFMAITYMNMLRHGAKGPDIKTAL